jgi:halimadienyl-diphosphate synthase
LRNLLGSDGSVGTSPSATAYYLTNFPDATPAWEYLDGVYNAYRYAPFVYPFRTFDLVWVLNSLRYSGQPLTDFATADHWAALQNALTPQGISSDPAFLVADGDSTSVTLRILLEAGMAIDPQILAAFQDSKTLLFRTYAFERNISISTNVHALETLYRLRQFPELAATRDSILTALMRRLTYDMYWTDKWNASPYYVTSHAIVAFLETDSARAFTCLPSIEWILHTQKDNGGWGYFQATTAEETAYALIALLHYHQHHRLHDVDVLHKAADYLIQYLDSPAQESPPLYIGKVLFAPYDIVRASVLASLIRYTDTFGRLL